MSYLLRMKSGYNGLRVKLHKGETVMTETHAPPWPVTHKGESFILDQEIAEIAGMCNEAVCRPLTGTPDYYTLDVNGPADFYLIADACGYPDLPLFHAAKKLLFAGKRGAKEKVQDVQEARDALDRWLEIREGKKP